jgi:hypothetical protein
MPAKRGTKKNRFSEANRIRGHDHHNYRERKARQVAERAINAFGTPMGVVRRFIPQVHKITGISETNLRRWEERINRDPEWRPWQTNHGLHRRIFTALEETAIVFFLQTNFIEQGLIFIDSYFHEIAMNAFLEAHANPEKSICFFSASLDSSHRSKHVTDCLRGRYTTNVGRT